MAPLLPSIKPVSGIFMKVVAFFLLVSAVLPASMALAQETGGEILPKRWQSTHFADNPLVGRIFKGDGTESSIEVLTLQAQLTRFVLLGEQHDNPDHHMIQAGLLRAVAEKGRRPPVVFEMVPFSLGDELSKFDLNSDPQLEDFAKRLKWEERGWYDWDIYRPVALAAIRESLPMYAGNLDVERTRALSSQGIESLSAAEQKAFGLTVDMPPALGTALLEELKGSHCGMMPDTALPAMMTVQRARDGAMADAMIRADNRLGAVLIAGNGHVRRDRAVPFVLRGLLPGERNVPVGKSAQGQPILMRVPNAHTLSVGLIEVAEGQTAFADHGLISETGDPLYDFVIFTPKFDITDHCAAMREQFKQMKNKKAQP